MIIGIDIDDTISDSTTQHDYYAKEFTEKVLKREFKIYETSSLDPMWAKFVYDWSDEENKEFWNLYYEKDMMSVVPKPNAVEIINELYKDNEIIIISARWDRESGIIQRITEEWLKKYNIKYHKLYMGHIDKRQIVADNKIDLFIDDALKTCTEVQSLGVKSLLMTTRLNKDIDIGNITRVNNWDEINEIIKSYNKAINDGNVIVEKLKGTNEEGENE